MITHGQGTYAQDIKPRFALDRKLSVRSCSAPYPHLRLQPVLQPEDTVRVLIWLQQSNS